MICPHCLKRATPDWECCVLDENGTNVQVQVNGICGVCGQVAVTGRAHVPLQGPNGKPPKPSRKRVQIWP